jgi:hypothetical protein
MSTLFNIAAHPYDFQTGITSEGRQVLMGLLCPHLVAYFFSPAGDLQEREARAWHYPAPRMKGNGPFQIYDDEFERRLNLQRDEWKQAMGFKESPIRVKEFFDKENSVGIEPLPEHMLDLSWCEDEEEQQLVEQGRDEWIAEGKFVFYWAKDYFMTRDGEVESS